MSLQYQVLEEFAYGQNRYQIEQEAGQEERTLVDVLAHYNLFAADRNRLDLEHFEGYNDPEIKLDEVLNSKFYSQVFEFLILQDFTFDILNVYFLLSVEIFDQFDSDQIRRVVERENLEKPFEVVQLIFNYSALVGRKRINVNIILLLNPYSLDIISTELHFDDNTRRGGPVSHFKNLSLKWNNPSIALILFFLRKVPLNESRAAPVSRIEDYIFTRRVKNSMAREVISLNELGNLVWQPASPDTLPGWNLEISETYVRDLIHVRDFSKEI